MFIPMNLHYTDQHLWVRPIGRLDMYMGITDFAQKELGRIDMVEISIENNTINEGDVFGVIYGANKTLRLIMPFPCKIIASNMEVKKTPRSLNSDSYHTWIVCVSIDKPEPISFLNATTYRSLIMKDSDSATQKKCMIMQGVEKLQRMGFVNVTSTNILSDEVYGIYFSMMLTEIQEKFAFPDSIIAELLSSIRAPMLNNDHPEIITWRIAGASVTNFN